MSNHERWVGRGEECFASKYGGKCFPPVAFRSRKLYSQKRLQFFLRNEKRNLQYTTSEQRLRMTQTRVCFLKMKLLSNRITLYMLCLMHIAF